MKSFSAILLTYFVLAATPASAEVFKWRDPDTRMTLSFPDDWRAVHSRQPDDILTLAAPGEANQAGCRMRVRQDRRFLVYSRDYADAIQHENYSRAFWEDYIHEFNGAMIYSVGDDRGLGSGFASQADISFKSDEKAASGEDYLQKRGLMFATVYNDKTYILECSAAENVYGQYHEAFLGVLKSVDFSPNYNSVTHGFYRNFNGDEGLRIHGRKSDDLYVH